MRILILGSPKSKETELLLKAAAKLGHESKVILVSELIFEAGDGSKITYQNKDLADLFDVVLVRGMNKHPDETLILCSYLSQKGVMVIDKKLASKRYYRTKLATAFKFSASGINYPQTYFLADPEKREKVLAGIEYPIIVKEVWGMHSQGVRRFKNKAEAEEFFLKNKGEYLIQEDLVEDDYLRVLVVGNEILGAMKRTKARSLSNEAVESGVKSEKLELTDELKNLALKAAEISKNDLCGLDFIKHNNKYYLLEANRSPQFRALSKIVGIDIAAKIIKFLEKESKNKK